MLRLLVALLAVLVLAGCGGTTIEADEVSGAPVELAVPDAEAAAALEEGGSGSSSSSSSPDEDEDADSTSTGTDEEAPSPDSTPSAPSGGGTTATPTPQATATPAPTQAPAAPQDDAQNDTSPPVDSGAERFEDFCQQNPGAC